MALKLKKDSLFSDALLYSIATGLNRGLILLIFPLLLSFLSVKDYGVFVLTFSVGQMLVPLFTFSGTAGILRDGAESNSFAVYLLEKFIYIVLINFGIVFAVFLLFNSFIENWIYYSLIFGGLNAIFDLFLSFFRVVNQKKTYFVYTIIKVGLLFLAVCIAIYMKAGLEFTFQIIVALQLLLTAFLVLYLLRRYIDKYNKLYISVKSVLGYTLYIIPHGLSLWLMNSSDKVIIKWYHDELALGIYSIAYTIGSIQILINSGLSIALPQFVYKNYALWQTRRPRIKVIVVYSAISFAVTLMILAGIWIDGLYFHFVQYPAQVKEIIVFVIPGLYLSGIYQFYSIYIFYQKKTKNLFYVGIAVAVLNLALNMLVIPVYGIWGAALMTLVTYVVYVSSVILYVFRLEPGIKAGFYKEAAVILAFTGLMVLMLFLF
ncbi:MAG: polysaccharide biosynthesis C-terminal domain-containing protein [Bacteroidota bacterium]